MSDFTIRISKTTSPAGTILLKLFLVHLDQSGREVVVDTEIFVGSESLDGGGKEISLEILNPTRSRVLGLII